MINLVGIAYGPIFVTAIESDDGLTARCPACNESFAVTKGHLEQTLDCPSGGCRQRLKLNGFVTRRRRPA
jgi:hypothetical protein